MTTSIFRKASLLGFSIVTLTVGLASTSFAHVVVKPAEVVTAGFQTFTVGVPNEKDIPTTSIKLVIPDGLRYVSPTQKTGWQIVTEKSGDGENTSIRSITWSGNEVGVGLRDDFTFSAQVPDKVTELQWKAYQTYSDGTVVSWDRAGEGGHDKGDNNSGPFSVTKIVSQTSQDQAIQKTDQAAADAKIAAERSLYVGIAALILSVVGIFLGTRRK